MQKYKLSPRQIATQVGTEVVILDHEDGIYYSLEEVGQTVWAALENSPQTINELVDLVCETYDTTPETCRQDLEKLVESLLKQKLIKLV